MFGYFFTLALFIGRFPEMSQNVFVGARNPDGIEQVSELVHAQWLAFFGKVGLQLALTQTFPKLH